MGESQQVQLKGTAVTIGMPIYGGIPSATAASLFRTALECQASGIRINLLNLAGPYVHISRDVIVDAFLKTDHEKLFFIDHDHSWSSEDFFRLLALSKLYPVVVGAYRFKTDEPKYMVSWLTTNPKSEAFGLIKVRGAGLGFAVIDRSVLQQLSDKAPLVRNEGDGPSRRRIFRVDTVDETGDGILKDRSEDIAFFDDVRALGVDVWLDPSLNIGHIGQTEYGGRLIDHLNRKAE